MGICSLTQGTQIRLSKDLEGWDGKGGGREVQEGGDRDIPGGSVAKTLCFQCRGPGFKPWSGNKREGTDVYLWLIHTDVWQKPAQFCKSFILQLKINFKT